MLDLHLAGANLIEGRESTQGQERFQAYRPTDGQALAPEFVSATLAEVQAACQASLEAFEVYGSLPASVRADFLDRIATEIEAVGEDLLQRANAETALPLPRLTGERGRTCNQLRLFATLLREGSWVDARIELANPERPAIPKPDLRRMLVPLGPVAVFGASNFPLAFSVAGGDTASALAAGCPVVVKAHPSHPGTSELVAQAIVRAVKACGMPEGTFALLHGGAEVGQTLVQQPEIYAVGFTGSFAVGRALFDIAARRPRPIPVYAEMGSVNPVFVMPEVLANRGEAFGQAYADSLTLGVGQFCTNPGVVLGIEGPAFNAFLEAASARLAANAIGTMLNAGIRKRFDAGIEERNRDARLSACTTAESAGTIHVTSAQNFIESADLREELFGPAAIAVQCRDFAQLKAAARSFEGQLTTTVHFEPTEKEAVRELLPILVRMAGRVIANGFPTGVEVNSAMQHGGPYPATTDSRSTSVGTAAIERFVRPVAFQDVPADLLPVELQPENEAKVWRLVDGTLTQ